MDHIIEKLRSCLEYNKCTGLFHWSEAEAWVFDASEKRSAEYRAKIWNSMNSGRQAFNTDHGTGYLAGCFLGTTYKAHRVAWALHYGKWPDGEVDHINGNRSDNRIKNLRDVTRSDNQRNVKLRANNKSGAVGVSYVKRDKRWVAQISGNGKRIRIGSFKTFKEAVTARREAEVKLGYHPNHGRLPT